MMQGHRNYHGPLRLRHESLVLPLRLKARITPAISHALEHFLETRDTYPNLKLTSTLDVSVSITTGPAAP
jgi:hypothetical protein